MPVDMKECNSSNLAKYGYDDGKLHVEFKSGAKGYHDNVSPEQFADFEAAVSKGSAYQAMFRGRSGHPWTPAGAEDGAAHAGNETHPLAHIAGIDDV